jgi:hypothetical protein
MPSHRRENFGEYEPPVEYVSEQVNFFNGLIDSEPLLTEVSYDTMEPYFIKFSFMGEVRTIRYLSAEIVRDAIESGLALPTQPPLSDVHMYVENGVFVLKFARNNGESSVGRDLPMTVCAMHEDMQKALAKITPLMPTSSELSLILHEMIDKMPR